ncbi:MAG: hypothetical protein E7Z91_06390 [Cyanobacteria bacterium SIG30]|nr:hypothetical protein [Cyanobacteria bacterium SIG30]
MIRSVNNNITSFKGVGATDTLVKVFEAIGRGGKTAEFLVQDVSACGVPRTISSLNRNKEKTGKLNYIAGIETGLREGLTGSSMFLVPMGVLAAARKLTGKANDIQVKSIRDLSEIIKKSNLQENARGNFYHDVFTQVGQNMSLQGKELTDFADDFTKKVMEIEAAPKRNIIARMFSNKKVGAKDQLVDELVDSFTKIKKNKIADIGADLTKATLSDDNAVSIDKLVKYIKDYADDFIDGKKCQIDIDKFKHLRMGSRFITTIGLTVLSGIVLVILPKIYSISKTNPEAQVTTQEPQGGQK